MPLISHPYLDKNKPVNTSTKNVLAILHDYLDTYRYPPGSSLNEAFAVLEAITKERDKLKREVKKAGDEMRPEDFIELMKTELQEAELRFTPMVNAYEAYAVIQEELDEFWDEVKEKQINYKLPNMLRELVQIATMCIRAAKDLKLYDPKKERVVKK